MMEHMSQLIVVLGKVEHILNLYGIIKEGIMTCWNKDNLILIEKIFFDAIDVHVAATNYTNTFINIAYACIPKRDVTIWCEWKVWLGSNLRPETRKRDRLRKCFIRSSSTCTSAEHRYKQQRNTVSNLKNRLTSICMQQ